MTEKQRFVTSEIKKRKTLYGLPLRASEGDAISLHLLSFLWFLVSAALSMFSIRGLYEGRIDLAKVFFTQNDAAAVCKSLLPKPEIQSHTATAAGGFVLSDGSVRIYPRCIPEGSGYRGLRKIMFTPAYPTHTTKRIESYEICLAN